MLEIRKGIATKSYENTFFREFADNLKKMFENYSLDGLLIANSECVVERRLQIDALLVTPKAVCIIDFKNFGGKIILPGNSESEHGIWKNEKGEQIKGGSTLNPFIQLKKQKERFIKVVEQHIKPKLPLYGSSFNASHTVRAVCFQKPIELVGKIPPKEELNFFIFDKSNYLETIKDIIEISDKEVMLTKESFDLFKNIFRANIFNTLENYDQIQDFIPCQTKLDFENLYPDQKAALNEIDKFIKSEEEKIFILQGTSLSGKTHLIPFIQEIAFNNQIKEVKLFALSNRILNNLLKGSNLEFESIYSYIYGGNSTLETEKENEEEENKNYLKLEIVPLLQSDDTEDAIFIVDESHLISDSYHEFIDLRFGSGNLLKDFLEFADLKKSKRKIIFIGDIFQLSLASKEYSSLNPNYFDKYGFKSKTFQLDDKNDKSTTVKEALKLVNCIRNKLFNNLSFNLSENFRALSKENIEQEIKSSFYTNSNFHILCYSNSDAQKVNYWIKKNILQNGSELNKDDLVIFENNIQVEDEKDPYAEPKKIFNGQFATVINVSQNIISETIIIKRNIPITLEFRELTLRLNETGQQVKVLSLENFRLSKKCELSREEIISFKILLNNLAEKEIPNFKSGKYHADDKIKSLIDRYEKAKIEGKKKTGKTELIVELQKRLRNIPSSNYYKFKNSALLRFGWALTVHKSMYYKWDEIYFNVETNGGKTESYFKWIYTGLIRSIHKVSLINYKPITPFSNLNINPVVNEIDKGKDFFYVADSTTDLSNFDKTILEKFKFSGSDEHKSYLLQLFQFIENKIAQKNFSIDFIKHNNYQELYEIKGSSGEFATISFYYNKRGQFRMPTLIKTSSNEFGEELLKHLKTHNHISDFSFINCNWRKTVYEQLNQRMQSKGITFGYIIQFPFKDRIQFNKLNDTIVADLNYDGNGFFKSLNVMSCTNENFLDEIQNIFFKIKDS